MDENLIFLLPLLIVIALVTGTISAFVALARTTDLRKQVTHLDVELRRLKRRLRELAEFESQDSPTKAVSPEEPSPLEVPPVLAQQIESPILVEEVQEPVLVGASQDLVSQQPTAQRLERPKRQTMDLESWLGRRFMAVVGAFILLIGIAFFLKYAYDLGWIGESGRLVIGALAGAACLQVGRIGVKRQLGAWADLISGLGFSIWYVCIYFAFEIYELWTQPLSFGVGAGVTLLALNLALRRDSWPLMAFALLGGFLCPQLFWQESSSLWILYGWISLLSVAGLSVASLRSWILIGPIVLAGATLLYVSIPLPGQNELEFAPAVAFHLVSLAVFGLVPYISMLMKRVMPMASLELVASLGVGLALLGLYQLYPEGDMGLASLVTAAGGFLLLPILLLRNLRLSDSDLTSALGTRGAIVLLTGLTTFAGLPFLPILTAATAAGLARRSRSLSGGPCLSIASCLLAGLAVAGSLFTSQFQDSGMTAFLRAPFWGGILVSVILALGCHQASLMGEKSRKPAAEFVGLLALAAILLFGLTWQIEIAIWWQSKDAVQGFYGDAYNATCLQIGSWCYISLATLFLGQKAKIPSLRNLAIIPVVVVVILSLIRLRVLFENPNSPSLLFVNLRCLTALLFAFTIAALGRVMSLEKGERSAHKVGRFLMSLAVILVSLALFFDVEAFCASREIRGIKVMRSLLVLWTALVLIWSSLSRFRSEYVSVATVRTVMVLATLWILIASAGSFARGQIPILNIDMALRVFLAASLAYAARFAKWQGRSGLQSVLDIAPQVALAIASANNIWEWSSVSQAHLYFLGPVNEDLGTGMISAVWSLHALALMVAGFLLKRKDLRVVGLAFFGIVMLKVLLVDTSSLPRIHRILSFIASGVLMLLGSYMYQRIARLTELKTMEVPGAD